jgi:hypothetical protein
VCSTDDKDFNSAATNEGAPQSGEQAASGKEDRLVSKSPLPLEEGAEPEALPDKNKDDPSPGVIEKPADPEEMPSLNEQENSSVMSPETGPSNQTKEESHDPRIVTAQEDLPTEKHSDPAGLLEDFSLPNGKDGEKYRCERLKEKIFGANAPDISHYYFEGLEGTGISLLENEDTLDGIPELSDNEPKSINARIFYHLKSHPRTKPFQHCLRFTINPDPRKLWQNRPSDRNAPFWKKDQDYSRISENRIGELFGASLRGRSHAHEGKCRDDHYSIKYFHQSGWWLSIVADGAGSAEFSRMGSQIACTRGQELFHEAIPTLESESFTRAIVDLSDNSGIATKIILETLGNLFTRDIGYKVFAEIHAHAQASSHRVKDYHTTFLISAWKLTPKGWFVCAFAIGDGGIAVVEKSGVTPLSKGDGGEFSGETVFLTSQDIWKDPEAIRERVKFGLFTQLEGIYAMTDGISDPKFGTDHNFCQPEKWSEFLSELDQHLEGSERPEEKLLDWMNFWSLGDHDDRTLTIFKPTTQANDK